LISCISTVCAARRCHCGSGAPRWPKSSPRCALQFSGKFADPLELLAIAEKMNLEGIVGKKREPAYRSGPTKAWVKVKTATWLLS
jgi:hypothetical protein